MSALLTSSGSESNTFHFCLCSSIGLRLVALKRVSCRLPYVESRRCCSNQSEQQMTIRHMVTDVSSLDFDAT